MSKTEKDNKSDYPLFSMDCTWGELEKKEKIQKTILMVIGIIAGIGFLVSFYFDITYWIFH